MFEETMILDPNYVAAYYQLGKVNELLGDEETQGRFTKGHM
jgi:hypothetical protein